MWDVSTTEEFDNWFCELDDDAKVEVIAKVELLKVFGPALRRPHADTLNGSAYANMKELRASTAGQEIRIAFAFDPARKAVLLVGGNKSGVGQKRFYKQLIARADAQYATHLARSKARRK
jgi:hypothetical protein